MGFFRLKKKLRETSIRNFKRARNLGLDNKKLVPTSDGLLTITGSVGSQKLFEKIENMCALSLTQSFTAHQGDASKGGNAETGDGF